MKKIIIRIAVIIIIVIVLMATMHIIVNWSDISAGIMKLHSK